MSAFTPDSNCMVATLLPDHVHHAWALATINDYSNRGFSMIIVGHTLLETYAVLTRLPPPSRVLPAEALRGLTETFMSNGTIFAPDSDYYRRMVNTFVSDGVIGGRVYDASIAACARAAGADVLLTINERHFRQFEGDGLTIVVP